MLYLQQNLAPMKLTLTLLFSTLSFISFGQKVRYLNENFIQVNFKDQAAFYTETFQDGPQAGTVKTYNLQGVLISEEAYSNLKKQILHGISRAFYPDGKLKSEINFKDGVYDGPLRTFYPNQRIKRAELFEKGVPVQGKCFSKAGYDTTFFAYHNDPQFKGGEPALAGYLVKNSRFPLTPITDELVRKGFVKFAVIKFTVNTEGKISDVILSRSISEFMTSRSSGAPFDKEAVRLVSTMPAWEPGKRDGENVVSEHWITIGFR